MLAALGGCHGNGLVSMATTYLIVKCHKAQTPFFGCSNNLSIIIIRTVTGQMATIVGCYGNWSVTMANTHIT